ncbi:restriction modification system DNA specificity domain protein [Delftia sp. Cs1-4]|uniref:restriction endonuclease subunit S n=1 Tax=Delftia sp. (strain Cs1-4) TaxID=742013 RepID=UPI00020E896A|nr:restriction endonuclease subunit S [Delftia sp. Cs1-4]AEF91327.1 restriction modification system DNA specificity domain protein [Delftia sp. Cs1-4]
MSRYKAYPQYEKSKLQWADRTPKHWNSVHLRWIAKLYAGGTPSKAVEEYWANGSVPWINSGEVNQGLISEVSTYITEAAYKNSSAKWIPKNALVMALAGQGKTKGMIAQLAIDATCNQSMAAIVPQDLQSSRYLFWWLHSNYQNIRNMAGGDLRDGLNLELLGDIGCPIPSVEEQLSIAAFLDHETAKIDALIEKQQRLIELLKEKRQAVISHAVTKGLNPNAPMKDSGVEWLGEVPAHWEVKRLKNTSQIIDCRNKTPEYFEDGEYFVVRTTNVKNQVLTMADALFTDERNFKIWTQRGVPPVGSILFTREAPAGEVCLVPENVKFCLGQRMMNFICHDSEYTEFLFDFLISDCLDKYIESVSHGSTVSHLRVEQVENIPVVVPPAHEAKQIHAVLAELKSCFSELTKKAEEAILLMQERRTALISAAVTGKIDVRDWQAAA